MIVDVNERRNVCMLEGKNASCVEILGAIDPEKDRQPTQTKQLQSGPQPRPNLCGDEINEESGTGLYLN